MVFLACCIYLRCVKLLCVLPRGGHKVLQRNCDAPPGPSARKAGDPFLRPGELCLCPFRSFAQDAPQQVLQMARRQWLFHLPCVAPMQTMHSSAILLTFGPEQRTESTCYLALNETLTSPCLSHDSHKPERTWCKTLFLHRKRSLWGLQPSSNSKAFGQVGGQVQNKVPDFLIS